MAADDLSSFDLSYFVRMLNESQPSDADPIAISAREPTRAPFWNGVNYRLASHDVGMRGTHFLMRQYEIPQLHPFNREGILGYVNVEAGDIGRGDEPDGRYESLVLRVSSPIGLNNGLVVPKCRISMCHEFEEFAEPCMERTDEVRLLGFLWRKADLKSILPTEWFLKKPREEYSPKKKKVASK